jgi:hypothetical protein
MLLDNPSCAEPAGAVETVGAGAAGSKGRWEINHAHWKSITKISSRIENVTDTLIAFARREPYQREAAIVSTLRA